MGDTREALERKYGAPRPPMDLDKARAEHRARCRRDEQQGLIVDAPAARNTDPETSHHALARLQANGTRASDQKRVLEKVLALPGLTYLELAVQTGLDKHTVMKRLNDLQGKGKRPSAPLVRKGATRLVGRLTYTTWWPA
jgi:hypothetical protein